jgi:type IV pilus modification protein PilV
MKSMHRHPDVPSAGAAQQGTSLIELMIALLVLAIGVLSVAQLFPTGSRAQVRDRMLSTANFYTQDKLEELRSLPWTDAALTAGRHPSGTATEALGTSGQWKRFYQVTDMAAPLDNLKLVVVTVSWTVVHTSSVSAQTYIRR